MATYDAEKLPSGPYNVGRELSIISRRDSVKSIPRGVSRARVAKCFEEAFEMIGGTTRLAVWAHESPGEFYKLYAKLLPGPAMRVINEEGVRETLVIASEEDLDI